MRPHRPPMPGNAGFTLVELMLVLVIAGVLAAVAAPSFNVIIESQRARGAATDIYVALMRARGEAIKRNANMTLSPKSGSWANGWQMLDPATSAAIEDHNALRNLTVSGPSGVTYQSSGRVSGGTAPSFGISGSYSASSRCVAVDLSGRPNIKAGSC